jgi:hypothetical protein
MEEIRKLIKIVSNRAEKNAFGVDLDVSTENPSLEEQLYVGARDGQYLTDDNASQGLYGADSTDHRFRMLKSRLKTKLLNLLFLVDFKENTNNSTWQNEQDCENHLQRAKILLKCGEYEMSEKQVNKAIAISRECEYTHITIESLRILRLIYSERFKPTDFYRVVEDLNTMIMVQQKEDEANNTFSEVSMNLRKSMYSRKNTLEDAAVTIGKLETLYKKTPTFNAYDKFYRLKLMYLEFVGDYSGVVATTAEAENLLADGKLNQKRFDIKFNYYVRTYAYLRSKDFDSGLKTASNGMEYFDPESSNWFSHMENYMLLALHSKSYKLAHDLMGRVSRNSYMEHITEAAQQRWQLFNAYLSFVIPSESAHDVINFDNYYISIKEYNKEKRSYNTAILILEFLHYLKEGSMDRVKDRIEGLLAYMKLHFSDPGLHSREKLFMKILKAILSTNFDPEKARAKSKKYYVKLNELVDPSDVFAEIEIIPFEHTWEHTLELLAKRVPA